MGTKDAAAVLAILCSLLLLSLSCGCLAAESEGAQTALLEVDTSWKVARKIPQTLFGLFFEVHVKLFRVFLFFHNIPSLNIYSRKSTMLELVDCGRSLSVTEVLLLRSITISCYMYTASWEHIIRKFWMHLKNTSKSHAMTYKAVIHLFAFFEILNFAVTYNPNFPDNKD